MKYKGYIGDITEADEDAELFHGEVIGIKDVVTFQGKSYRELKKLFKNPLMIISIFVSHVAKSPINHSLVNLTYVFL